jgi:hypothetical protein
MKPLVLCCVASNSILCTSRFIVILSSTAADVLRGCRIQVLLEQGSALVQDAMCVNATKQEQSFLHDFSDERLRRNRVWFPGDSQMTGLKRPCRTQKSCIGVDLKPFRRPLQVSLSPPLRWLSHSAELPSNRWAKVPPTPNRPGCSATNASTGALINPVCPRLFSQSACTV